MITRAAASPNRIAKQLTGRDYVSYSAMTTYAACPLRYYFRYVKGLPERFISSNLVFGSAIHAALELHYRELLSGTGPPSLKDLLGAFWTSWNSHAHQTIQYGKRESLDQIGGLAERMLRAFQASKLSQPTGTILGIEEELRRQLVSGVPDLLARLDLLVEHGDEIVVTDFKTSRNRWTPGQANLAADQLLLYGELARDLVPDNSLRLRFIVITKAKMPEVGTYEVRFDRHQLDRTKAIMRRVWRAIAAGHFYPAPSAMNCAGCPYRRPCQAWRG